MATTTVRPQPQAPVSGGSDGGIIQALQARQAQRRSKMAIELLGTALSDDDIKPEDLAQRMGALTGNVQEAVGLAQFVMQIRQERRRLDDEKELAGFKEGLARETARQGREFQASESEKDRSFRSEESAIDRAFRSLEGEKGRTFRSEESEKDRSFQAEEGQKGREFEASQLERGSELRREETKDQLTLQEDLLAKREARQRSERQEGMDAVANRLDRLGEHIAADVLRSIGAVEPGLASTTLQTTDPARRKGKEIKARDVEVFRRDENGDVEKRKITLRSGEDASAFDTADRFKKLREEGFSVTEPADTDEPPELKKYQLQRESAVRRTGLSPEGAQFFADNENNITNSLFKMYGTFDPETKEVKFFEGRLGQSKLLMANKQIPRIAKKIEDQSGNLTLSTLIAATVDAVDLAWDNGLVIVDTKVREGTGVEGAKALLKYVKTNLRLPTNEAFSYLESLIDRGVVNITFEDLNSVNDKER